MHNTRRGQLSPLACTKLCETVVTRNTDPRNYNVYYHFYDKAIKYSRKLSLNLTISKWHKLQARQYQHFRETPRAGQYLNFKHFQLKFQSIHMFWQAISLNIVLIIKMN
jgi:hypothetical protein